MTPQRFTIQHSRALGSSRSGFQLRQFTGGSSGRATGSMEDPFGRALASEGVSGRLLLDIRGEIRAERFNPPPEWICMLPCLVALEPRNRAISGYTTHRDWV